MASESRDREEMVIRVLKDGRIVIDGSGLSPRRIRELQDTLQEVVGPAQLYDEELGASPEAPRLWGRMDDEDESLERERHGP